MFEPMQDALKPVSWQMPPSRLDGFPNGADLFSRMRKIENAYGILTMVLYYLL